MFYFVVVLVFLMYTDDIIYVWLIGNEKKVEIWV